MGCVRGLSLIMDNKKNFGELSSNSLKVGDIIEWSRWNSEQKVYEPHYGILLNMKNEIRSSRVVSISKVKPLNQEGIELEFFTLSLRLFSRASESIEKS